MGKFVTIFVWLGAIGAVVTVAGLVIWAVVSFPNTNQEDLPGIDVQSGVVVDLVQGDIQISEDGGKTFTSVSDDIELPEESNISYVGLSPDKKGICFLVQTFAPQWLYYAHIDDGKLVDVKQVAPAGECVWSHNSRYIAFTNHTTDVSPHNVYMFFTETKEHVCLTSHISTENKMRIFKLPSWSEDDEFIYSDYAEYDFHMNKIGEGTSTIRWSKGEIVDN